MEGRDLGGYLIRVRRARMRTQGQLAREAGVSPTTVSGIESGKISRPHFGTLRKLARVLEMEPEEFFGSELSGTEHEAESGDGVGATLEWSRSVRDEEFERELERATLERLRLLFSRLDGERERLQRVYGGLPRRSEERLYVKGQIRQVAARSESVSTSILFHPGREPEEEERG